MASLKRLASLKETTPNEEKSESTKQASVTSDKRYYEEGYGAAKKANGESINFKSCLDDIYERFKDYCRNDEEQQKRLKEPFENEKKRLRSILNAREAFKSIKEDELKDLDVNINEIDANIAGVRNNPPKYIPDAARKSRAPFYMGLIIIFNLTLYLLAFYISASYSAFFRVLDTSITVIYAILDPNALILAINDGWLEAVFVCTIPFVFLGLGYLIHVFQKERKNGIKMIVSLLIVTFIFDAIIAYQIEAKFYDLSKLITDPPFNLQIAFFDVQFWAIIFAGFVVYIIWGLVFDFMMKEYENIEKINDYIDKQKKDKSNLIVRKNKIINVLDDLKHELDEINKKINDQQSVIDGFVFDDKRYLRYYAEFRNGWYMAIRSELQISKENMDHILDACEIVCSRHLEKLESNYR